uniref:ATP synthase complex subunit 8 n=1 Tax=Parupeneus multifasciatus TaxID=626244 RepID=A0A060NTW6_9TELE|nr:ATP synthase F0 subunit 8 [Parupeneus multifasciatus]WGO62577.1 ATP synthase F0 subunit 8 [Parupeneus multifasciatus]BAO84775.1 ATPase subunit 8 [Parupeneus multifasciatus]
MPQLDPAPWFTILVYSWFILLTIAPPKVLAHTFPAEPTARSAEAPKTNPWDWTCP